MPELPYDVVVIGAGPAGLIAALSASQGTPFWAKRPERMGKILVLEEHAKPGGIAAFGILAIFQGWMLKGGQLKSMLLSQVDKLPIEIRCGTSATGLRREGESWAVDTTAGTFRASTVIIACGIFSHLRYLTLRNAFILAETTQGQKTFLTAAEKAAAGMGEAGGKVLMVGVHPILHEVVERARVLSPGLVFEGLIDSVHDGSAGALDALLSRHERRANPKDQKRLAQLAEDLGAWNDGSEDAHADYLAIAFDYNTYKARPENAVRLARGSALAMKDGYILADHWGRTNLPGVWACGNAVFPLSGVLQALYTGFVAGLGARSGTALAADDEINGFLPWLAVPNSLWAGWLASARDLFDFDPTQPR